ncbi:MAG TPA: rRNA maturation RNase YbeY [Syntrophales bacterium]|nr:rRNA maturation RNase YbeY [Syntrophales bacterium]
MSILIENRQKKINIDLLHVKRVLSKIMNYLDCKDKEISLLFVNDNEIRKINKRYLNRGYSTNVLTFSLSEGEFGNINPKILGDIVISVETALKDAQEAGTKLNDELEFLMVHGMLHLLNYDHENVSEDEVKKMEMKEQEVLSALKK